MLNWPKEMNTAMWHEESFLVYHPQLHGLWLSTEKGQRQKNLWPKYFTEVSLFDSVGVLTKILWKLSKFCFKFCVLEDQK
jgi:hypothetical protein